MSRKIACLLASPVKKSIHSEKRAVAAFCKSKSFFNWEKKTKVIVSVSCSTYCMYFGNGLLLRIKFNFMIFENIKFKILKSVKFSNFKNTLKFLISKISTSYNSNVKTFKNVQLWWQNQLKTQHEGISNNPLTISKK